MTDLDERLPPHDIEAEANTLGFLVWAATPEALARISGIIQPGSYFRAEHQVIAEVITALVGRGDPCGVTAVADELRKRGLLQRYGGHPFLYDLVARRTVSPEHDAGIVAELAERRRIIASAKRAEAMAWNPGAELADVQAELARLAEGARGNETAAASLAARYAPVDWETAWKAQPESVEWLVEPFIEAGTLNVLFAQRGTGKSLIALEWALRMAREDLAVVYVDRENRQADVVERLQAFGVTPAELPHLQRYLLYYAFPALPPLDTPEGGRHLVALAEAHDAVLVIIDTTMRFASGEENSSDTFTALYNCSMWPLKSRGIAVLRLDHPGKNGELRGSGGKADDTDTVWKMTEAVKSLKYKMHREKNRTGHAPDFEDVAVDRQYSPLRHAWDAPDRSREIEAVRGLSGQLDRFSVPLSAGRTAARTVLVKHGVTASNALLSKALKYRKTCPGNHADRSGTAGQPVSGTAAVRATPVYEVHGVADRPPDTRPAAAGLCAGCGGQMKVIEPGQQYHPMCQPEEAVTP